MAVFASYISKDLSICYVSSLPLFLFSSHLTHLCRVLSVNGHASHTLMATSQVDFSRIPNLEEVKFDFYPQEYITEASLGNIRNFLLDDLLKVFGIPQHNGDQVSVKILDLGRIPLLLVQNSPALSTRADYARDIDRYPKELAKTPFIAFDRSLWGVLDAALCTRRFANLERLRIDYVIFDIRNCQPAPEGYKYILKALVTPCDWLSITKRILPLTVAAGRVGLEGRVIEIMVASWAHEIIDYLKGVCRAQYP